ncbi:hypothetical protein NESM_000661200 [Novymonas esmeraldas]|uniref:Uncharacterized protein n=1 Tax=Novymonas esmeraldas TaxID=1808958 RepID=A0AAW0EW69_9TRYP
MSQPASGVKKLRFDESATSAAMASTSDACPGGANNSSNSARSAMKAVSPTSSGPSLLASSLRRPSEAPSAHSDAHVQLNPTAEVIEHDGSITTVPATAATEAVRPVAAMEKAAGEVANFLADVGAGVGGTASSSGSAASASGSAFTGAEVGDHFRSLLLQLAGLILEHRPKDPEQYIVDHLHARMLSSTAGGRASSVTAAASSDEAAGEEAALAAGSTATLSTVANTSVMVFEPEYEGEMSATAPFVPHGDTVVERLASNALPIEIGRAVLTRLAEQLISAQPDDPEDFLWARLGARSFGEDATHNAAVSAAGYPVARLDDPTQMSLLKDIAPSSPGYVVAVSVLPLLFAKKPVDPISYLFYHVGSRARSSVAQSAHSSARLMRLGDDEDNPFDGESCISRDFADESDSAAADDAEIGSTGGSTGMMPLQRKGSLGTLFDSAAAAAPQRRRSERLDTSRQRPSQNVTASRTSSLRRSLAGAARTSRDATATLPLPDELAALSGGAGTASKRVSIAHPEGKPRSPTYASYDSSATPMGGGGMSVTRTNRTPSLGVSPNASHRVESDEQARVREEFGMLRLREELRLERLQHEIRTLTRECEYRNQMALLNRTDRMADRAATTAREALEEAHRYRAFLGAQVSQLEVELQRQLRLLSQQAARPSPPLMAAPAPWTQPPMCGYWAASEGARRYAEAPVPSEVDILKKQVELLSMEQARARSLGYGVERDHSPTIPHSSWIPATTVTLGAPMKAAYTL